MAKRLLSVLLCLLMMLGAASAVTSWAKPVVSFDGVPNLTPYEGSYGEIKLKVTGAKNVKYQWQAGFVDSHLDMTDLSENEYYKGVNTNHFKLLATGTLYQLDFRCKITYDGGVIYSSPQRFAFLTPEVIPGVNVTGIKAPAFGETPDFEATDLGSDKYKNGDIEWYGPITEGSTPKMSSDDVFVPGQYKCRMYIIPEKGYTFDENSKVFIKPRDYEIHRELGDDGYIFYAERYQTVIYDDTAPLPEGFLDFEWRKPDIEDNGGDNYLGMFYLGTKDMNTAFAFKPKSLPANMYAAGYYLSENTYIRGGKDQSILYYENTGKEIKLSDFAGEMGKYSVEQSVYLMSPDDEKIATRTVSYVIDVLEPQRVDKAGITFNAFPTWTKPFYEYVARTPEIELNTIYWSDITDGEVPIDETTDFIPGHTYRMNIWLGAKTGYLFTVDEEGCPNITASVNGMPSQVAKNPSAKEVEVIFEFTYKPDEAENPTEPDPTESTVPTENFPTTPTETTAPTEPDPTESTAPTQSVPTNPTETTASSSTESTPSNPTDPVVTGILGDANEDGKVNVKDATAIQKHIASLATLSETGTLLADVDKNKNVNIKDATAIQKFIAGMSTGFTIGEPV